MNRRRALLALITLLALADLVGLVVLREAWIARHHKAEHQDRQAMTAPSVNFSAGVEPVVARTGR